MPAGRAVEVRGVPRQQHAPAPEMRRHALVLAVGRGPHRLPPGPLAEQNLCQLSRVIGELGVRQRVGNALLDQAPYPRRIPDRHKERRAIGLGEPPVRGVRLLAHLDIGKDGSSRVGLTLQLPAELLPNAAVGTVRPHEESRLDDALDAFPFAKTNMHAPAGLIVLESNERASHTQLAYSDEAGRGFRFEAGRRSEAKPATIPI